MKRALGVLGLVWAMAAGAQNSVIGSLPGTGTLTWESPATPVLRYRVEWASSQDGPWTPFSMTAHLDDIAPTGTVMSAAVPMFYRIVAEEIPPAPSGMVLIPGGTNAGADPDFGAYSLTVTAFYMDQYEVTQALWDEVYTWAITNGYSFGNAGSSKAASHPVHTVNWYDVVKWCNARSQKEGRPQVYTVAGAVYKTGQHNGVVQTAAAGYRLPTDVEWKYAARGGVAGRRFPWGDSDEIQHARANYNSRDFFSYDTSPTRGVHPDSGAWPHTMPVGSFAANGYGVHDMAGNVAEWCFSESQSMRVFGAGCWANFADFCRVGDLLLSHPDYADYDRGFRAVLPPASIPVP